MLAYFFYQISGWVPVVFPYVYDDGQTTLSMTRDDTNHFFRLSSQQCGWEWTYFFNKPKDEWIDFEHSNGAVGCHGACYGKCHVCCIVSTYVWYTCIVFLIAAGASKASASTYVRYTLHKKFKDICQYLDLKTKIKANSRNSTSKVSAKCERIKKNSTYFADEKMSIRLLLLVGCCLWQLWQVWFSQ